MRARRNIVLTVAIVVSATTSFATSCVWGKKFKIHDVCGKVRDSYGAEITNAVVQLKKLGEQDVVAESQTSPDGTFAISNVGTGDYEIRIKSPGFWDASQSFQLIHPAKGTGAALKGRAFKARRRT